MGFWMDFVEFCYSLVFVIRNSLPCHGIFHRAAAVVTVDEWRVGLGKGGERRRREIRIKEDIAIDRVKLKMKRAWDR